jgi:protein-tyrosine phosphatase
VQGEHVHTESVLIVCTANQCRSPLAAALLERALAGTAVEVHDVGTGESGFPVTPETSTVATRFGLDLSEHRSTTLTPEMVARADLVLTMERVHVRDIVVEQPDAWAKTFTLKEFVRRAEETGARPPEQSLGEWLETLHEGRNRIDLLGASPVDDVADPTGDRRVDHDSMAEELDALVDDAVALAWPGAEAD